MSAIPIGSRHIFVDESGDPNLDINNPGVSGYFVLCAVIVDSIKLGALEEEARAIIYRYFPKGELKSSKIGSNTCRRQRVLNDISHLDFKHYSQVIDKGKILTGSGLQYRRSFVKYVNRALYENLFKAFTELHVFADQFGTSDFMKGFSDYLLRKLQRGLFENHTFTYASSAIHPLIQVADVIAGSILRCYSGKDDMSILDPIRSNTIIIDEWPPYIPEPIGLDQLPREKQFDFLIRRHAVLQTERFIEKNSSSNDPNVLAQVAGARYLLYHFRSVDPTEYVTTETLRRHLKELGFPLSIRSVRSKVISSLRREGVFIASSGKGIKIPLSVADLRRYVQNVDSQVVPYIKCLSVCREHFLLATEANLDIVGSDEFPELHKIVIGAS